jgi:hypothetical protein
LPFGKRHDVLSDSVEAFLAEQVGFDVGGGVSDVRRRAGLGVGLVEVYGGGGALLAVVAGVVTAWLCTMRYMK